MRRAVRSRAWVSLALIVGLLLATVSALPSGTLSSNLLAGARGSGLLLAGLLFYVARRKLPGATLALGPGVLALLELLIGATGGVMASAFYPLVYLWLAIVAGLLTVESALLTAGGALAIELCQHILGGPAVLPLADLLAHAGFMAVFASLFAVLLVAEVRSVRGARDAAVKDALERAESEARDFRLIGSVLDNQNNRRRDPAATAEIRKLGSVRAIRDTLVDVLEAARLALGADTAVVFVLNEAGSKLRLAECVAREGEPPIEENASVALEGALGAVVTTRRAVNLQPRSGGKGLGYETRARVGSFLGVPVMDECNVAAVLAVDRELGESFSERDEEVLAAIAREASRAIESERIFSAMDKAKYEQERFYEAFTLLNEAISVDGFAGQLMEAVGRIKPVDFIAVTRYEVETGSHQVVAVRADDATKSKLFELGFHDKDGGLVAMALKNGHALPYVPLSGQADRGKLQLFGKESGPTLEMVKVFPLLHRGTPLGGLVLGSLHKGRELTREEERMLDTVTAHAANTLANARMYQRMETMATTDGLTGLCNHRRFKELLDEALARATRFKRSVSVLMVDADHFKAVNDTYGHPVGDLVLKRIAALLGAEARRTDVVARYGGEEFVLILDETDALGARLVAERIRQRIEAEQIHGDFGRLKVTASVGICSWPHQAETRDQLLERSDEALYDAKRKGRNRVEGYRSARASEARSEPPAAHA